MDPAPRNRFFDSARRIARINKIELHASDFEATYISTTTENTVKMVS
jgi:hypothetical protein